MLRDAHELPKGHAVHADVCVIGSGPAGITIAKELSRRSIKVCMLAGGAREYEEQVQSLYDATTSGDPYLSPLENRRRQLGGTSNMWVVKLPGRRLGVRLAKFDALDFEKREWVSNSGWPFSLEEIEPFYDRAQAIWEAGPNRYDHEAWATQEAQPFPVDPELMQTVMFQFAEKAVFDDFGRNGLEQDENVEIWVNGHAVELIGERGVTNLRCKATSGESFEVRARVYVVAAGAVESTRILLAANGANGIGTSGALGLYYMDHLIVSSGHLTPSSNAGFSEAALYDLRRVRGTPIQGALSFSEEAQRHHQLLNAQIALMPQPNYPRLYALLAFKQLGESVLQRRFGAQMLRDLRVALSHPAHVAMAVYDNVTKNVSLAQGYGKGGWSSLKRPGRRYERFELMTVSEQAPDPDNRITLSPDRDALGMRQAHVHWSRGSQTLECLGRARGVIKRALEGAGVGAVDLERGSDFATATNPQGTAHNMGATRMHGDPTRGVVDSNCKVHGVDNLFVASSSVFPTGSHANPTLTIVALSIRLGDRLVERADILTA
jgi:choline dehydrogenase-like flavoprotein